MVQQSNSLNRKPLVNHHRRGSVHGDFLILLPLSHLTTRVQKYHEDPSIELNSSRYRCLPIDQGQIDVSVCFSMFIPSFLMATRNWVSTCGVHQQVHEFRVE